MTAPADDRKPPTATELLAAQDQALAGGEALPTPPCPPEMDNSLHQDLELLQHLHAVWPHSPRSNPPDPPIDGDAVTVHLNPPRALSNSSPPQPPPQFGRFQLIRLLGKGGFGVVYHAVDSSINRHVALKVPRPEILLTPELRQRFVREALMGGGLDHPHLVPVYEAGEVGPICYIASAYIPGVSLATWLREHAQQPMSPRLAARLVAALADAVHHAHARGIIHRDLKPGNVLLQQSTDEFPASDGQEDWPADLGFPRVCDFGLARQLEGPGGDTCSGAVLGTPEYMAPEQAGGRTREIGITTDVYALGAILYECLTGKGLFSAQSRFALLQCILTEAPVPPSQLRPGIPRDLETICLKCLHKEPGRRYPSALDLARDLRAWLEGSPICARRHGPLERLWLWARREPYLAAVSTLATLALLALPALAVWFSMHSAQQASEQAAQQQHWQQQVDLQQELARNEAFYRLLFQIRERRARATQGWTWDNLRDLLLAARLPAAADNRASLLSEAAACHSSVDLRLRCRLDLGFTPYHVAFSPDGKRLALVEGVGSGPVPLRLLLIDPHTGKAVRRLSVPANLAWQLRKDRSESATAMVFSPDGRWLIVGTRSGMLHRWNLSQPDDPVVSWQGHAEEVARVAFSPDSAFLFSLSSKDGSLQRWSIAHNWAKAPLLVMPPCRDLVVMPGRRTWLVRDDGAMLFVEGDALLESNHSRKPDTGRLVGSPDGRTLANERGEAIEWTDLLTGRWGVQLSESQDGGLHCALAISPDGRLLARLSSRERCLQLWDLASGRLEHTITVPGGLESVAFSPDGRSLAVTAERQAFLYEVAASEQAVFAFHAAPVRSVAFTSDSQALVCVAGDVRVPPGIAHEVTLWPLSDRLPLRPARQVRGTHVHPRYELAHNPLGGQVAFVRDHQVIAWDPVKNIFRNLGSFAEHGGLGCGPDGRLWAAWNHDVYRSPIPDKPLRSCWTNSQEDRSVGLVFYSLAVGRRWALAGRRDGKVFLFEANSGKLHSSWDVDVSPVTALALAASQRQALVGTELGKVFLVELPSGKVLKELPPHRAAVTGLGFAGANLIVSGSRDRAVSLWKANGELLLRQDMPAPVEQLAVSPDGCRLAVVLRNERAVRLWRLDRLVARLEGLGMSLEGAHVPPPSRPTAPPFQPVTARPPDEPNGIKVEVFADRQQEFKVAERYDRQIDLDLKDNESPHDGVGPTHFGMRWTGWLKAPKAGKYTFRVIHDDGVCLWLDGKARLVQWGAGGPHSHEVKVDLSAGPHALRVDLWQELGPTNCLVLWRRPGCTEFEVVPAEALFHNQP